MVIIKQTRIHRKMPQDERAIFLINEGNYEQRRSVKWLLALQH